MQRRKAAMSSLHGLLRCGGDLLAAVSGTSSSLALRAASSAGIWHAQGCAVRTLHYYVSAPLPQSSLLGALPLSPGLLTNRTSSHSQASCSSLYGVVVRHLHRRPRRFPLPPEVAEALRDQARQRVKVKELQLPTPVPGQMGPKSVRVGCIAVKAGMTQEWDEWGVQVPLTVLWVDDCQVVGTKFPERDGYWALQVGAGYKKQKCLSMGMAGFYLAKGVPFKREMREFRVSEDAMLPIGTPIGAAHFVVGQRLDVTGWTKWKDFQGGMKRWGFAGQPASHGTSLAHRSPGTVGSRKDPGKVFKGKKMAGFMGDERRTVHNVLVYKTDPARNLVYVRGQVPGPAGEFIYLRDAKSVTQGIRSAWGVPFPTALPALQAPGGDVAVAAVAELGTHRSVPGLGVSVHRSLKDPYRSYSEDIDYFEVKWKKAD